jgi:hypothetical protein
MYIPTFTPLAPKSKAARVIVVAPAPLTLQVVIGVVEI